MRPGGTLQESVYFGLTIPKICEAIDIVLQEFCDRWHSNVGMYVLKCLRIALMTIFNYKHYKPQSRSRDCGLWCQSE